MRIKRGMGGSRNGRGRTARTDVAADQALIHWLASCGLTEQAASQFRSIDAPVIAWASLATMFDPIPR